MKRNLTHLVLVLICSYLTGLGQEMKQFEVLEDPIWLPVEASNSPIIGLSPDGRYIYGSGTAGSFCYDTERDTTSLFVAATYGDIAPSIKAVTNDGEIFVGGAVYSFSQSSHVDIVSPDAAYDEVIVTYVTTDAQHLVGYLMDNTFSANSICLPIVGERNAQGGYDIHILPMPDADYFGYNPNYTQAFLCSEDGTSILGRQNTWSGSDRPLFWTATGDAGTYEYHFPCDTFLYNLEVPLPGPEPNFDEIVTADPELDPELYDEQWNLYDELFAAWEEKYYACLTGKYIDQTWQIMSPSAQQWMLRVSYLIGDTIDASYPAALDLRTGAISCLDIPVAQGKGGINRLDDGAWICYGDLVASEDAWVIYPDGTSYTIVEWLKEASGRDFAPFFTYSYTPYGSDEPESLTVAGTTHTSADGKTLAFTAGNYAEGPYYRNAYMRIDRSLSSAIEQLPIARTATQMSLESDGEWIYLSEPITFNCYMYDSEGRLIQSQHCQDCDVVSLAPLPKGVYIVQIVYARGVLTAKVVR